MDGCDPGRECSSQEEAVWRLLAIAGTRQVGFRAKGLFGGGRKYGLQIHVWCFYGRTVFSRSRSQARDKSVAKIMRSRFKLSSPSDREPPAFLPSFCITFVRPFQCCHHELHVNVQITVIRFESFHELFNLSWVIQSFWRGVALSQLRRILAGSCRHQRCGAGSLGLVQGNNMCIDDNGSCQVKQSSLPFHTPTPLLSVLLTLSLTIV